MNCEKGSKCRQTVKFLTRLVSTAAKISNLFRMNSRTMKVPKLITGPTRIPSAGNQPKLIDEYIGGVNSGSTAVSIAHMRSPGGWQEPGQTPDFDEYTIVLKGSLRVEHQSGVLDIRAGQAVIANRGEWIRYSTPEPEGAEYIAVCIPAFSPATVHRD